MNQPETPFETASYELNQFRERRMADRRFSVRTSADRRMNQPLEKDEELPEATPEIREIN
ncbi:MAG: hypothetical protein JWQ23_4333 [Herminiimonas sp.]|nr:hypothetical protein [Herminiimonas sp.]